MQEEQNLKEKVKNKCTLINTLGKYSIPFIT